MISANEVRQKAQDQMDSIRNNMDNWIKKHKQEIEDLEKGILYITEKNPKATCIHKHFPASDIISWEMFLGDNGYTVEDEGCYFQSNQEIHRIKISWRL